MKTIIASNHLPLPDTGARTNFETGAVRDASVGKGIPSSIPPCFIRGVAQRFEDGARKYSKDNWLKGIPYSRFVDAIFRHTMAAAEGKTDESHLAAVGWNVAAWMETERRVNLGILPKELNDLAYYNPEYI